MSIPEPDDIECGQQDEATFVDLLEDNAGQIYVTRSDQGTLWCLGPVTADMHGQFEDDVCAWFDGEWAPGLDGAASQVPNDRTDLTLVASYEPGTFWRHAGPDQCPVAWLYIGGES